MHSYPESSKPSSANGLRFNPPLRTKATCRKLGVASRTLLTRPPAPSGYGFTVSGSFSSDGRPHGFWPAQIPPPCSCRSRPGIRPSPDQPPGPRPKPRCTYLLLLNCSGDPVVSKRVCPGHLLGRTNRNTDFVVDQPVRSYRFFFTATSTDPATYPLRGYMIFTDRAPAY